MTSEMKEEDWVNDGVREAVDHYDYVRFTFSDINGISRSKLIRRSHVVDCLKTGIGVISIAVGWGTSFEVVSYEEVEETNHGNVIARPIPGTLHPLPWAADGKYRIGEVLCETFWSPPYRSGGPQGACPRYVARTQLQRLSELGYQLMSGFEAEFFVYRGTAGDPELTRKPLYTDSGRLSSFVASECEAFFCSMAERLSTAGVDVVAIHVEYMSGQMEFALAPAFGIDSADRMFILKEAVKEMCASRGWHATFMTKPAFDDVNLSATQQFSSSLWIGQKNAFRDHEGIEGPGCRLSAVGRQWTAGLLKHVSALTALCCPTVNCYHSIQMGVDYIPATASWGFDNRHAMLRVVDAVLRGTYIENRLPSSAANPYITLAASVAAGIDGLVNNLELPDEMSTTAVKLPSSLSEALAALEADTVICDALGDEFIRWFVTLKRDSEISKFNNAVETGRSKIEIERELYLKML